MPNEGDAHMLQAVPHFLPVHIKTIEEYFWIEVTENML